MWGKGDVRIWDSMATVLNLHEADSIFALNIIWSQSGFFLDLLLFMFVTTKSRHMFKKQVVSRYIEENLNHGCINVAILLVLDPPLE